MFRWSSLRHYGLLAVVGITLPNLFYYYAAPHLSAGILSITVSTVPLFTYAIMLGLGHESVVAKRMFGILLGMLAIVLLVVPDQGLQTEEANLWVLLVVLCALFYATENVYIGHHVETHISVLELLCGSNILAVFIQLALALGLAEPVSWLATSAGMTTIALALTSTAAYSMFFYTIKVSGPVFASQCAYLVTIFGVLWGILLFSEQHSYWVWLSVAVMMIGLALVNPKREASLLDT